MVVVASCEQAVQGSVVGLALVLRYVTRETVPLEQSPTVWGWMPFVAMRLRRVVQVS